MKPLPCHQVSSFLRPLALMLMLGLSSQLRAQEQAALPPEMVGPEKTFISGQKTLDDELVRKAEPIRDTYLDAVKSAKDRLEKENKPKDVDLLNAELEKLKSNPLQTTASEGLPGPVKVAFKAYLADLEKARGEINLKRKGLTSAYKKSLAEIGKTYEEKKDTHAVGIIRRALAGIEIRSAFDEGRTVEAGEVTKKGDANDPNKKPPVTAAPEGGGYLIGIDYGHGEWAGKSAMGRAQPIFLTPGGESASKTTYGIANSSGKVVAREGYAVGGVILREIVAAGHTNTVVGSMQLIFMKINPDGLTLDPKDSYTSDQFGGTANGKPKEINCHGHLVIGMKGYSGDVVDAAWLVGLK